SAPKAGATPIVSRAAAPASSARNLVLNLSLPPAPAPPAGPFRRSLRDRRDLLPQLISSLRAQSRLRSRRSVSLVLGLRREGEVLPRVEDVAQDLRAVRIVGQFVGVVGPFAEALIVDGHR